MTTPVRLHTLLGTYPNTQALVSGSVKSPLIEFDFVEAKNPAAHFKRVVRDLEFDVAEIAIITYLMAKAHGKPLVLLPVVMFSRFQHPYLVYDSSRGTLAPKDLEGKRIAIRSYTVTTCTWLRGILAEDHGVDLSRIQWLSSEDPHVAEFRDPPNVKKGPATLSIPDMVLSGEADAAIVADVSNLDPRLKTVIPDPAGAARAWRQARNAIQVNHMAAVSTDLLSKHPDLVREVYRMFCEAKRLGPSLDKEGYDPVPYGVENNRRNLDAAIECVYRQGLIPRRYSVDELFDDVTRALN